MIFIDFHLPKKHGLDCLREVGATAALKHIPIVMYTSWGNPDDITLSIRLGAKLYFQKPSNYKDLVDHLGEIVKLSWNLPHTIEPKLYKDGEFHLVDQ